MKVKSMAKNTSKVEKKGALSIKNVTKIYDPTGVNVWLLMTVPWKLRAVKYA